MSPGHAAKRNRATWALVVVFVGLVTAIALIQWRSVAEHSLPVRSADTVAKITITRNGHAPIVLQREQRWQIVSPVTLPANEQRVIPLLTVYTNPDPGYAISSVDLDATGLNSPEVTVSFNDYDVKIGQVALDGTKRHALHGDRVRFVPDWLLPFLQGGVSAIADLTVWGNELEAIEFKPGSIHNLNLNADFLTQAKQLIAQQHVAWPRPENPTVLDTIAVEATINNEKSNWLVHITDRYVAIQPNDTKFAYIAALDEVPWLLK